MHKAFAVLALVGTLGSTTGCYFGRSQNAKSSAYVANGALLVVGGALMLSTAGGGCSPDADISCGVSEGTSDGAVAGVGALFALGGAIGLAINLLTTTEPPAPAPAPRAASTTASSVYTVTAPGLAPATFTR